MLYFVPHCSIALCLSLLESLRLPLAKGSSTFLTKPLFNGLYTPFGSPVSGGQKPQGREDVTALQCCICPTCPSPAGGSLTHSQALALSKRTRDVTALLGARNRFALRLADHQSPRHVVRAGTAREPNSAMLLEVFGTRLFSV